MVASLLEQLREHTRPAHLALESHPLLQRLLSPRLTESEYGQVLQAFLTFYQRLEPALGPAAAALLKRHPSPDYSYSPRTAVLVDDCRALGIPFEGFVPHPIGLCLDGGDAQLLGVLYVIEGSTQGGRVIAKHLAQTLGVNEHSGARFFNRHRWDDSWSAFRRWFDTDLADLFQEDFRCMVEGADRTFDALRAHLDRGQ